MISKHCKTRKIISLAFVLVIMLSLLSGCGHTKDDRNEDLSSIGTEQAEPTDTSTELKQVKTRCELTYGYQFSDGVAWVTYTDPEDGSEKFGLMNLEGEIKTNQKLNEIGLGSLFSGGYSYVNTDKEYFIVDKQGNITAQSPEGEGIYSVLAGGDGVFLIRHHLSGLDINEDKYGLLEADGNWIVEPTTDSPLVLTSEDDFADFYYLGEHTFIAVNGGLNHWYIYNTDTRMGKEFSSRYKIGLYDDGQEMFSVYDGLFPYMLGDELYVYNTITGELETHYWTQFSKIFYHEGILFEIEAWNGSTAPRGAFYNLSSEVGDILLEYNKYPMRVHNVPGFYKYNDGCAAVIVEGADGGMYLGFIDTKGEFLFSPYQLAEDNGYLAYGPCENNAVYASIWDSEGNYRDGIINSDGSFVESPAEFYRGGWNEAVRWNVKFYNGYIWNSDAHCYIGTDGSRLRGYLN